jgi:hypothetical protein
MMPIRLLPFINNLNFNTSISITSFTSKLRIETKQNIQCGKNYNF